MPYTKLLPYMVHVGAIVGLGGMTSSSHVFAPIQTHKKNEEALAKSKGKEVVDAN